VSRPGAAAVAACALALVSASSAGPGAKPVSWFGFETPSGNIACNRGVPISGEPGISCVVFSESSPTKGQRSWWMRPRGRASVRFVLGNIGTDVRVLRYGRSWSRAGITCTSRSAGLTCRNRDGHGFTLSREQQRRF
jgi:hypothetical protein